jgi:hypothetical protein
MVTLVYMATLGSPTGSGGGGGGFTGSVTTSQISDMTAVGKSVATSPTALDVRNAIGAGTSNLVIGTTSTTAKAGNYVPAWTEVTSKPTFATVATTGAYADLTGKPTIPATAADVGAVPTSRTINGSPLSANVTLTKTDIGLGSVDNTADAAKPVSTPQGTAVMTVSPFGYILRYSTATGWPARSTKPSWWTGAICYAADDVALAQGVVPYPTDRIVNDTLLYRAGVMVGG